MVDNPTRFFVEYGWVSDNTYLYLAIGIVIVGAFVGILPLRRITGQSA
jgi:hypothetical protein